jgi:alpha-1,2-mannosyltransferase
LVRRWSPLALGLALHLAFQLHPAWKQVKAAKHGRDFASYYYGLQVAWDGGDPYDTAALDAAAREDHTRKEVNPYFYPPPFLLGVAWARPLSLGDAARVMLGLNEALLAACLAVLVRAFSAPLWAVGLLLASYTPIPDNAWMGQANLLALLPALLGLALAPRRPLTGGVLVGVAAMMKMSPALYLGYWLLRRQWRPAVAACVTAVGLSLATLPLVGPATQIRFYAEILPGFLRGDYHDLTVPISLPANHSIPDLWNLLWPGPTRTSLSGPAQWASKLCAVAALGAWAWRFRRPGEEAKAIGALTILMVVIPAYTYEHHLVFLLPAVLAAATLSPWFFVAYFFLAWPLDALRWAQKALPGPDWLFRESKFAAEVAFFLLLWRRPPPPVG